MKKYFVKPDIRTVTTVGIMIALEIIFHRFVSVQTPILQIHFGFLPIVLVAIMYGPVYSSFAWAAADFIGILLFPATGSIFLGFTVSAFIMGAILGLFLYKCKRFVLNTVLSVSVITVAVTLLLDLFWLLVLTGDGILALLPARLLKCAVMLPVQIICIIALKKLYDKLPSSIKPPNAA